MNARRFTCLFLGLLLIIPVLTQSAANAKFLSPLTIDLSFTDEANPPSEPSAVTIYVKADATGANNGTNWTDAYTDLQDALAAAISGDEIRVAAGTYKPGTERTDTFRLKNGVKLYGGFNGDAANELPNWELFPTILSGDLSENDNHNVNHDEPTRADNSYHVVTASGTDENTVLDGFTISGGNANGSDSDSHGGGMFNDNSHLKLHDIAFTSNSARTNGGGMYNRKSDPAISGVTFTNNSAGSDGGGMFNTESSPSLKNIAFRHNLAEDGGGMLNSTSNPTLEHVIFAYNSTSPGNGGGMLNTNNSAPTLISVTFSRNSSASNGGGLYNNGNSDPTLTSVIFNGNSSVLDGGGIFNQNSHSTLNNTLFTGNSAQDGGAMLNWDSSPTIINATFSGNLATNHGGGIYNVDNSHPAISNSIFWNNKDNSGTGASAQISGSTSNITYSLVQGGFAGIGNRDANPLFVESINPDDAPTIMGDFHLQPNSPAIDAGNNNTLPADTLDLDGDTDTSEPFPWDLDRSNRFQDHTVPDTGNGAAPLVDMGAYETGGIIYVKTDAAGANDGSSWVDAYTDLQDGLATATAGNEIWVAVGTYKPGTKRTDTFLLKNGVRLYGGFSGAETTHSQRDWVIHQTILNGDLTGNDNDNIAHDEPTRAENSYNVVESRSNDSSTVLDGFTITGGNANGSDSDSHGGGMYNITTIPKVKNIIFSDNSATHGGGMFNTESNPIVSNTSFIGNSVPYYGGGMYNRLSNPQLDHVIFTGNEANGEDSHGGGMYNKQSHPTITDTTFTNNVADYGGGMFNTESNPVVSNTSFTGNSVLHYGGGMYNRSSNPQLDNVIFTGNQANGKDTHGGGMYNKQSHPIITDATFTNNVADFGGGMFNTESNPTVSNTRFTGNSVSDDGGGMYNRSSNAEINNVIMTGNSAINKGGAIYSDLSHLKMGHVTISGNVSAGTGGGIVNQGSNPIISNSILWNNKDNSGIGSNAQIYNLNGSTPTVTYSIIQGGWEGEGNIDADPFFVSLINPDNAPTSLGNFHLQLGSAAIDGGSNDLLPADTLDLDGDGDITEPIPYDLDGNARIVNGTVDMGAYEGGTSPQETPSDLTLSKTVSSQKAQPGDTLTYRIELSATPEEVELSDTLPAGLSYVEGSLTGGASYDPTKQIRYTGTVSPDAPLVIEYQVTVDSDVARGSILYNAVVVTGANILLEDAVAVSIPEDSFNGTLVLLYVNGDNDLSEYMLDLVNRAEQGAGNEHLTVLLLLDGPSEGDTYLYRLEEDFDGSCPNYSNPDCNRRYEMGKNLWEWRENIASPYSLSEFLIGAQRAYPQANQIILSLVGHGGGWAPTTPGGQPGKRHGVKPGGLLWDDHFGSSLSTAELSQALSSFHDTTGRKIDLLYLDACLMAMFEVAYEISGSVEYLFASESWSWTSFSYDAHLNAIDDTMNAREIGEAWLANEANVLRPDEYPFTYSLIDLSKIPVLREALDSLATALSTTLPAEKDKIDEAFKKSACFDSDGNGSIVQTDSSEPLDTYCDLVSFASQLQRQFNGQNAVINAAQAVKEAVKEAVVAEDHHSGIPWQYSNEHWQWEELGGLSIYLPLLKDEWGRGYYNSRHLRSAKDGTWDEFLTNAYWNNAEPPLPPACPNDDCEPRGPSSIAPLHLQASSGHDSINIGWDLEGSLSGILDHYSLYRNTNGGQYNIIASNIDTQQYRDKPQTPGDEHCYYLQAFNNLNRPIGLSNVACVKFGTLILSIPNQSLPNGARDELVSVNLANGNGLCIGAMDLVIHYNATIARATGTISRTIYSQGYDLQADVSTPGQIRISLLNDNECEELYGAGSLFDIGFDINGEEGRSMELHFVSSEASIYSYNDLSNPLDLELENGSLTINESFIKGDANGHNKVETVDALLALRMASGKITPMFKQHTACDVNGDNDCTSADALLIRCYVFKNNWNQCGGSESPNLQYHRPADEPVRLEINDIEGQLQAGQTVTVSVALKNAPNFAGGDFTFVYDASQMSATRASLTSLTNDFRLQSNNQEAGILRVSMANRNAIGGDGDILELEFTTNSGASSIDFGSIRLNDNAGRDFETSALQQKIEIVPYQSSTQLYLPLVIR